LEDQFLHIQMKEVPSGEDSDGKLTVNCYQRCELLGIAIMMFFEKTIEVHGYIDEKCKPFLAS
jgi:hypothetical protein